jgi:hypothetical protein
VYLGGLVTLAVLLPNLLYLRFPPVDTPPEPPARPPRGRVMEIIERVGQAGVFILPFFYQIGPLSLTGRLALAVMAIMLIFYYSGWVRYVRKGRHNSALYRPMLGIPLPMAVAPILYFFAAAILLSSWLLAVATAILAVGHLYISQQAYQRCME